MVFFVVGGDGVGWGGGGMRGGREGRGVGQYVNN